MTTPSLPGAMDSRRGNFVHTHSHLSPVLDVVKHHTAEYNVQHETKYATNVKEGTLPKTL